MVRVRGIPPKHDDGVSAELNLVFAAAEGSAEGMRGVAIVVEDKVGMLFAFQPAGDLAVLPGDGGAHSGFGAFAVVPGGSGGNVPLVLEALPKLSVGARDMLAQRVAAGRFVLGEIAADACG